MVRCTRGLIRPNLRRGGQAAQLRLAHPYGDFPSGISKVQLLHGDRRHELWAVIHRILIVVEPNKLQSSGDHGHQAGGS